MTSPRDRRQRAGALRRGRRAASRVAAALVAASAATALGLWIARCAAPNIVAAGRHAAEEEAVGRLREIRWAQERVREARWIDRNHDGEGEYAFLGDLTGRGRGAVAPLREPPLQSSRFRPVTLQVHASEGYLYMVYLPARRGGADPGVPEGGSVDPVAAARRWVAYAWPIAGGDPGGRAFFIDQDERICETDAAGYHGLERAPAFGAALPAGAETLSMCGRGQDGAVWHPWRHQSVRLRAPAGLR